MTYIITAGIFFVLGQLHGQGKLIPWVRGAAGKARGVVLGSRPAASTRDNLSPIEVSPTPPKNPIRAGQALKNILAFFGGLLAWMAKNPVVAIGLVLLACLLVFGLPFGLGKSKGELRLERDLAEGETQTQETINERDTDIHAIGQDIALLRQQIENLSQRGRDDLRAAAPAHEAPIDPNLVSSWRANLDRMCVARADGSRADSCAL